MTVSELRDMLGAIEASTEVSINGADVVIAGIDFAGYFRLSDRAEWKRSREGYSPRSVAFGDIIGDADADAVH